MNMHIRTHCHLAREKMSSTKSIKKSHNGVFALYKSTPHILYVRNSDIGQITRYENILSRAKSAAKMDGYTPFTYSNPHFINDCLIFAECLTIGNMNYTSKRCVLKSKDMNLVFGYTDKQNMRIAKTVKETGVSNRTVNPDITESYAFVLTDIQNNGEAPYHIANVLFKDGMSNIILEADAGNKDANTPVFDIYDIDANSGHTFYDEMVGFYTDGPVSVKKYVALTLTAR